MPQGYAAGWKHSKELNWGGVKFGERKVALEGTYDAKVIKALPVESSTGKPMVKVTLEIIASDDPDLRESVGAKLFDQWLVVDDAGGFRLKNFALEADVDPPEAQTYDIVNEWCENIVDKTVTVKVKRDSYKGEANAKIAHYGKEPPTDREEEEESRPKGKAAGKSSNGQDRSRRGR